MQIYLIMFSSLNAERKTNYWLLILVKEKKIMNRRDFMKNGSIGFAALAASVKNYAEMIMTREVKPEEKSGSGMKFRTLGRTGLKVSLLGIGTRNTPDPQLVYRAIREYGVNFIEAGRPGEIETLVARGVGDKRKEVIIAAYLERLRDTRAIIRSVESSLRNLNTDYIDVMINPQVMKRNEMMDENVMEALTAMKKDGKVRFFAVSSHQNETEIVKEAIESNFYDVVQIKYNFLRQSSLTSAIAAAAEKGIGIVAMKVMTKYDDAGAAELKPFQAALRWVSDNKNVATAIPAIKSYAELDEDYGAVMAHVSDGDRELLGRYQEAIRGVYCRWCGECERMCPRGVAIAEINRALMYAEGYREGELAAETYAAISPLSNLSGCLNCGECIIECSHGADVKKNLARAAAIFT